MSQGHQHLHDPRLQDLADLAGFHLATRRADAKTPNPEFRLAREIDRGQPELGAVGDIHRVGPTEFRGWFSSGCLTTTSAISDRSTNDRRRSSKGRNEFSLFHQMVAACERWNAAAPPNRGESS